MGLFEDFLAEPKAARCWLLELDTLDLLPISDGSVATTGYAESAFGDVAFGEGDGNESSGIATLYFSTHGFTSKSTDTPASRYYDASLSERVEVERRIYGRDGVAGLARVEARALIINANGELDDLLERYALDGRAARLLLGRPKEARANFGAVASCIVQLATVGLKALEIQLSDGLARLDVPLNATTYLGTGGLEGGADLAGKPKPKGYGHVFNVSPPLVDSVKLIYQVNDGAISDVPMVYDRQVELVKGSDYASQTELEATAPAAGNYRVWKGGGFFRIGSAPAGQVTADVLGDATDTGYVNKTADIVKRILLFQAVLDAAETDAASFAALNVSAPAEVGIWRGAELSTVREVVEELLAGVGAFGGFNRLGLFTVGLVAAASGAAVASFDATQIGDPIREPMPADIHPVVWRARVAWQKNYTVQSDLAAGVTAARRAFAAQAERIAVKDDVTAKSRRPLAKEYGPHGNLYALQADANTEAQRLLDLWKADRKLYRLPLPAIALNRDLGEVVNIKHPRLGLTAGRDVRILGHRLEGARVELMVLA